MAHDTELLTHPLVLGRYPSTRW